MKIETGIFVSTLCYWLFLQLGAATVQRVRHNLRLHAPGNGGCAMRIQQGSAATSASQLHRCGELLAGYNWVRLQLAAVLDVKSDVAALNFSASSVLSSLFAQTDERVNIFEIAKF